MSYYLKPRHKVEFVILFFLILFAFAASSSGYWIQWAFLASIWGVLILVDFSFLAENSFIYDPDYTAWSAKTQGEQQ